MQGQKGDTVSCSYHDCLFLFIIRVQLVSLDLQDRLEKSDKRVNRVLKEIKAKKERKVKK